MIVLVALISLFLYYLFYSYSKKKSPQLLLERIDTLLKNRPKESNMDYLVRNGYYKHNGNGQFSITPKGRERAKKKAKDLANQRYHNYKRSDES